MTTMLTFSFSCCFFLFFAYICHMYEITTHIPLAFEINTSVTVTHSNPLLLLQTFSLFLKHFTSDVCEIHMHLTDHPRVP